MSQRAGGGRGNDAGAARSCGHERLDSHEHEQGSQKKTSTDPEESGKESNNNPRAGHPEDIHAHLSDRKKEVHDTPPEIRYTTWRDI